MQEYLKIFEAKISAHNEAFKSYSEDYKEKLESESKKILASMEEQVALMNKRVQDLTSIVASKRRDVEKQS